MKDELHGYTKAVSFVCLDKHNKNINDIESQGQRTHITARDESHANNRKCLHRNTICVVFKAGQ